MRIVDLSMTVEECDSAPFAKDEYYFKVRPIVRWEDKGFVSNMVEMTVHAGTHIDSPHHFFRDKPNVEQLPLEAMVGEAVVLDLTFKGTANARITPNGYPYLLSSDWMAPYRTERIYRVLQSGRRFSPEAMLTSASLITEVPSSSVTERSLSRSAA